MTQFPKAVVQFVLAVVIFVSFVADQPLSKGSPRLPRPGGSISIQCEPNVGTCP